MVSMRATTNSATQRLRAVLAARARRKDERDFANRVCDEAITALRAVHEAQAGLQGDALYVAVVARRANLDAGRASAIVEFANESLEDWGSNRTAKLIDVVRYMIVSEYMVQRGHNDGMTIDLGALLSPRIDPLL